MPKIKSLNKSIKTSLKGGGWCVSSPLLPFFNLLLIQTVSAVGFWVEFYIYIYTSLPSLMLGP